MIFYTRYSSRIDYEHAISFMNAFKLNAPVIDQLPVTIECKVIELQEEFKETRVVAEIVGMKADESVLTDGKVDLEKLHPIMFDTVALCYREIGANVGDAWSAGRKFE